MNNEEVGSDSNFAIIGVAGYVAPRHLQAIKSLGCGLSVALDRSDSVGILDSYFPHAAFFSEFERFDRHIDKLKRQERLRVDYVTVCSPNYLHDAHCRFSLRSGANVICEKPLVLNPWNLDGLELMQQEFDHTINTILQLRLHPTLQKLKASLAATEEAKRLQVELCYITPRGSWYNHSWKGDERKSGGIATNIGIHFFDMLYWLFGKANQSTVHVAGQDIAAGNLVLERADVRWFLSTNPSYLPQQQQKDMRPYRSIKVNGEELEFSEGFKDLHVQSYEKVLAGNGFGVKDARPSIEMTHDIRHAKPVGLVGDYHPMLTRDKQV